jgi:multicomponent Na+:H+ antiporter subunit G
MIEAISIIMIISGLIFFLAAVVGIIRFPDFYTRMHAAGKGDTLSSILVIGGIALYYMNQDGWTLEAILVGLKMFAIVVFIFIASPTSTHVLMQAGYDSGIVPISKKNGAVALNKPEPSENSSDEKQS